MLIAKTNLHYYNEKQVIERGVLGKKSFFQKKSIKTFGGFK